MNKRTIVIEINGGEDPHVSVGLSGEKAEDDRINHLAQALKVVVGEAVIRAMSPITKSLGFGSNLQEAKDSALPIGTFNTKVNC